MSCKKKNKPACIRRVALDNPYSITWPEIDIKQEEEVKNVLNSVQDKIVESGKPRRTGLICGLNAVSRSIEKDKLAAVLLAVEGKPPHLAEHLIPMCAAKGVPVIALRSLCTEIAQKIKLTTLLALGITKEVSELYYSDFVTLLQSLVKPFEASSLCKAITPVELRHIPPPPIFLQKTVENTAIESKPESLEFMSFKNGTFPGPSYPVELDTLIVKIHDPNRTVEDLYENNGQQSQVKNKKRKFDKGMKRKQLQEYIVKEEKLVSLREPKLKTTVSEKGSKKKKRKNNKGAVMLS